MKTKYVIVKGKIKFIHPVNFNKFGVWAITIYPDTKSLEIIRELQAEGIKNVMKKDDDGYFIQFRREPTKRISGRVVAFAAPVVIDKEDKPMDGNTVGWGSDCTVRLEVYQHNTPNGGKSQAARWDSVKIDNLVPYTREQLSEKEAEAVDDLSNSPKPVWN